MMQEGITEITVEDATYQGMPIGTTIIYIKVNLMFLQQNFVSAKTFGFLQKNYRCQGKNIVMCFPDVL
jgi:hypothetical protein